MKNGRVRNNLNRASGMMRYNLNPICGLMRNYLNPVSGTGALSFAASGRRGVRFGPSSGTTQGYASIP